MSRATIERFYAAFARLDVDTMVACYALDARFDDEAFSLQGRAQVAGMWRMLCESTRQRGLADWKLEASRITDHTAHWEARYRFMPSKRLVHNIVEAEFEFDADGLILRHRDRFDFWRWTRQAMGAPGLLLGWTPWLRSQVRAKVAQRLQADMARRGP
jgi:limonene-1,2-epoxide hydrolase